MPPTHARLMRFEVAPDHLKEARRIVREEFADFYQSIPSYRGALALVDKKQSTIVTISLWRGLDDQHRVSPEDVLAYVRNVLKFREAKLISTEILELETPHGFEVGHVLE